MSEKFLIIQTAFIGDAILTLPMIQVLKEKFPNTKIDIVAIHSTQEIFSASPSVNEVYILDKHNKHKSLFATIRFAFNLRKKNYAKIISPHRSLRSSILVLIAAAKESIGYKKSALSLIYKIRKDYCSDCHEVERNLLLIDADISKGKWKIQPELLIRDETKTKIAKILAGFENRKFAAIAPGSVWETKKYPKEYFAEIVKLLSGIGVLSILIGGKEDENLCGEIASLSGIDCLSLSGQLSILESTELLKHCKVLISNDSAPTHMGMIADIPTVTIFCSTVPGFGFFPYNKKSVSVSYDELDCKPCGIHGHKVCPTGTFDCAKKLRPTDVFEKIKLLID